MRELDKQERKIMRELIRNPRISDNKISQRTKIPVMTVNRKRKRLEKENLIHYFSYYNKAGDGKPPARQMYIIKFKSGITKSDYLNALDKKFKEQNAKTHLMSFLGEKDGHFASIIILEAETPSELTEIFNGAIIPGIKKRHGEDCIDEIFTCKVNIPLRCYHNYLPSINMKEGKITDSWPDDYIFVG